MSKRYFKIDTYGSGCEIVCGQVSEDYLQYWKDRGEEVFEQLNDPDYDEDSPPTLDNGDVIEYWSELDSIVHLYGATEGDCTFTVVEVDSAGEAIGDEEDFEPGESLYSRESGMVHDELPESDNEWVPAIMCTTWEKGGFFTATVETGGEDFDPDKIHFGVVESQFASLIEQAWYGEEPLELDCGCSDTNNKGMDFGFGYVSLTWERDDDIEHYQPGSDNIKELFENLN